MVKTVSTVKFYDAHNHLQDEWLLPHIDRIAADQTDAGIAGAVVNGTTPDDWAQVSALATRFAWVVPSYGVHPWDCGNRPADWLGRLESRLASEPRAHVGEIGLDRWILDRAKPNDPRLAGLRRAPLDEQIEVFAAQLALAAADNRAASIHCVDAWGAMFDTLRSTNLPARGFLLHAYAGPVEMIKPFTDLGAYFSFNGSYLDSKRENQRNAFKSVPANRLLVETDAPAMPLPSAGRLYDLPARPGNTPVNHPANIVAVYQGLAQFLNLRVDALAQNVESNSQRLFH
jgi:TatD DNase family protein